MTSTTSKKETPLMRRISFDGILGSSGNSETVLYPSGQQYDPAMYEKALKMTLELRHLRNPATNQALLEAASMLGLPMLPDESPENAVNAIAILMSDRMGQRLNLEVNQEKARPKSQETPDWMSNQSVPEWTRANL